MDMMVSGHSGVYSYRPGIYQVTVCRGGGNVQSVIKSCDTCRGSESSGRQ